MKRAFDVAAVVVLAPILVLVLVLLAVLVRTRLGKPVFFTQARPGLRGAPFRLIKFRSMTDARDGSGQLLPDGERMTHFGRWLRASSLDELPEVMNVLAGEMSLVGPRPLLMDYLPLYTPEQARRHGVPPGITGWTQINGRNALLWEEKFALDTWYVDHRGLWLDLKILAWTVLKVVRRDGISAEGEATMPRFEGASGTGGQGARLAGNVAADAGDGAKEDGG